jgi:hypothetical protein
MLAFGTTTAGMVDHFKDASAASKAYSFHEVPLSQYMDTFHAFALGGVKLADELGVDGSRTILRGNLGAMLPRLLGREPRRHELDAWFTFCIFDRTCTMDVDEYAAAVQQLQDFSAAPAESRTYSSYTLKETHR